MIERSHLFTVLVVLLCAVVRRTRAERACLEELCLECDDCAIMTPAFSYTGAGEVPTVGSIREACWCIGCPNIPDSQCNATHAVTGAPVPDNTKIFAIEEGGSVPINLTESIIKSNLTDYLLSYACPSGCNNIQYGPVIEGDQISAQDLKLGCTCTACPKAQVYNCLFFQDDHELDRDAVISSLYAFTAEQIIDEPTTIHSDGLTRATVLPTTLVLMAIFL